MKNSTEEIQKLLENYAHENYNKGRALGYQQGIDDFYNMLLTTHLTPSEIYNKLRIDKE